MRGAALVGDQKGVRAKSLDVLPNEMRLSCGAMLERSQTDGLHSKTAPPASSAC